MKKIIVTAISFAICVALYSQPVGVFKTIDLKTSLKFNNYQVVGISNDTTGVNQSSTQLITEYAVKKLVTSRFQNLQALPSQSGNSGKFLTTNGSTSSWAAISAGSIASVFGRTGTIIAQASDYNNFYLQLLGTGSNANSLTGIGLSDANTNTPTSDEYVVLNLNRQGNNAYGYQLGHKDRGDDALYIRGRNAVGNGWGSWYQLASRSWVANVLAAKSDISHTHSYGSITGTPTNLSNFTNDLNFLTPTSTHTLSNKSIDNTSGLKFNNSANTFYGKVVYKSNAVANLDIIFPSTSFSTVNVAYQQELGSYGVIMQTDTSVFARKALYITAPTSNYTLLATDAGGLVTLNLSASGTLTIPTNASVSFPIGTQIIITQEGAGQITLTASVGVTLQSADGATKTRVQFSAVTLIKKGTNTWQAIGDII